MDCNTPKRRFFNRGFHRFHRWGEEISFFLPIGVIRAISGMFPLKMSIFNSWWREVGFVSAVEGSSPGSFGFFPPFGGNGLLPRRASIHRKPLNQIKL
jgi:hypothetical protein